jgi:serine protease Do
MTTRVLRTAAGLAVVIGVVMSIVTPAVAEVSDFRDVVRRAKDRVFPAVVYIRVVQEATEQGKKGSQQISGSGVLVSPEGDVLTNWHVVDKAQRVRCQMSDGRAYEAEVLGSDQDTDLAMIRLQREEGDDAPLPYATIGDSSVLVEGDFVMAMGAPYGLNRSVSMGIISCTRRYLPETSEYSLWFQTDAAINPGNSGGPLVDTNGLVIGLNTRGMSADGMGFAVPSETIKLLMPQLRDEGKMNWSWTGLQLQALRDFNRDIYFDETEGVIVGETDPGSPARRAGVQPDDRVIRVNGEPITALTEEDLPSVRRHMALLPKDEPAMIELMRDGELMTIELTPREKGSVEGEEFVCERWNLTVKLINQFDNPNLFFHRKEGVFAYGLDYPGNATSSGIQRNDIILKIDGKPVKTLEEVEAIYNETVEKVDERHRIVVVVLRNGLMRQLVLDFLRDYERE